MSDGSVREPGPAVEPRHLEVGELTPSGVSGRHVDPGPVASRRSGEQPRRRRIVAGGAAALVLLLVAVGFWSTRSGPGATLPAAPTVAGAAPPARSLQTGATYVATRRTSAGGIPDCAPSAATWRSGPNGSVVADVVVSGPKQVSVVVLDEKHPERPNTSHASVSIGVGKAGATVTVPVPPGGIDRVQVGIQGDQGIQQCIASRTG